MNQMKHIGAFCLLVLLAACSDEPEVKYEVNRVEVYQSANDKTRLKTESEFISISYADLYGKSIPYDLFEDMGVNLSAFGDKTLIQDLMIRNFLNDSTELQVPTEQEMRGDVDLFIEETYLRFLSRYPTELENWKLKKIITEDPDITPEVVYYGVMTSLEYRHY